MSHTFDLPEFHCFLLLFQYYSDIFPFIQLTSNFPNIPQITIKMSGTSNVGNSQVYEDGDQKNAPKSEMEQEKKDSRFHEGKENSHKANDSSKLYEPRYKMGRVLIMFS